MEQNVNTSETTPETIETTAPEVPTEAPETLETPEASDNTPTPDAAANPAADDRVLPSYLSDAMRMAGWKPEEIEARVKEIGVDRASAEFTVYADEIGRPSSAPKQEAAPEFALKAPDLSATIDKIKDDYPEMVPVLKSVVEETMKAVQEQLKPIVGDANRNQQAQFEHARRQEEAAVHKYLDDKASKGYGDFFGTAEKMNRSQAQARQLAYQRAVQFKQADPSISPEEALDMASVYVAKRLSAGTEKRDEQIQKRSAQRRIAPASGGRGGEQIEGDEWAAAEAHVNRHWRSQKG